MALIDFTLSNARRFYSSMGNPLGWKGLSDKYASVKVASAFRPFPCKKLFRTKTIIIISF